MELNDLLKFTLLIVFVGLIIGTGVLITDKFAIAARTATNTSTGSINVTRELCAAVAGYVTTDTAVWVNSSNAVSLSSSYFAWDKTGTFAGSCVNVTDAGVTAGINNSIVNVTYTYGAASAATNSLNSTVKELGNISSNWLGLIITIAVLSIIVTMVIQSFGGIGGRK